jgi:hypothetical protein
MLKRGEKEMGLSWLFNRDIGNVMVYDTFNVPSRSVVIHALMHTSYNTAIQLLHSPKPNQKKSKSLNGRSPTKTPVPQFRLKHPPSPQPPRAHRSSIPTLQLQTLIWTTLRIKIQPLQPPITPLQTNIIKSANRQSTARVVKRRLFGIHIRNLDL